MLRQPRRLRGSRLLSRQCPTVLAWPASCSDTRPPTTCEGAPSEGLKLWARNSPSFWGPLPPGLFFTLGSSLAHRRPLGPAEARPGLPGAQAPDWQVAAVAESCWKTCGCKQHLLHPRSTELVCDRCKLKGQLERSEGQSPKQPKSLRSRGENSDLPQLSCWMMTLLRTHGLHEGRGQWQRRQGSLWWSQKAGTCR